MARAVIVGGGTTGEAWRARVWDADGRMRGAGVLLDGTRVLTCAHVVARALGMAADGAPPEGAITLDFPASRSAGHRLARTVAGGWFPPAADGRGDLAVLAVDDGSVEGVPPPVLRRCGAAAGRMVRVYGYPDGMDDGVWAQATVVGSGGPGGEWIQMDGLRVTGRQIEPGFSGSGVVDDQTGAVIGLVMAVDRLAAAKVSWMAPLEVVADYWPPIGERLSAQPATDARRPRPLPLPLLFDLVDLFLDVPVVADEGGRRQVLDLLRREIAASVPRHPERRIDVLNLLRTCLNYPGGLGELLQVVRRLEGDSLPLRALERALADLPDMVSE